MSDNGTLLTGIKQISAAVNGYSENTIMRWKREYPSFPIRKLCGVWVGDRAAIVAWFRAFSEDALEEYEQRAAATPPPAAETTKSRRCAARKKK